MNTPLVRKIVAGAAVACAVLLIAVLLVPRSSGPIADASPSPSTAASASPSASESPSASPTASAGESYRLTVEVTGAGNGSVISIPAGIDCPTKCSALFAKGVKVVLEPRAGEVPAEFGPGYETVMAWSAPCPGPGTTCEATMNSNQTFRASFTIRQSPIVLQVTVVGAGGIVTSSPTGIDCGTTCLAQFAPGNVVTLTATAASGYVFVGWAGACTGTGPCTVTLGPSIDGLPVEVTATFAPNG